MPRSVLSKARTSQSAIVDPDALQRASQEFDGRIAELVDVSNDDAVAAFVAQAQTELGGLDAPVSNPEIADPTGSPEDISSSDWRRCLDICLTGQFPCARQAIAMIKAANGGCVINMALVPAKHSYAYRTPYSVRLA